VFFRAHLGSAYMYEEHILYVRFLGVGYENSSYSDNQCKANHVLSSMESTNMAGTPGHDTVRKKR